MKRKVGFQKKFEVWNSDIVIFSLLLSFHVLILLIKFAFKAYFSHPKERMDLTLIKYEHGIPLID